jgi:DNA-binding SARP family transcriptional activator
MRGFDRVRGAMPSYDGSTATVGHAVRLHGTFALTVDGQDVELPLPSRRLVALLSVHERPLSRLSIAGLLWPDATQARGTTNLRSALRCCDGRLVERSKAHLRLAPQVAVDYRASLRLARDVRTGRVDPTDVAVTMALVCDELLPDWPDDWIEPFRARHRHLRLDALETMAEALLDARQPRLAAEVCLSITDAEPLRESAHLLHIKALLAEGNRANAIQHYRYVCRLIEAELGMPPSFRLTDVMAESGYGSLRSPRFDHVGVTAGR